MAEKVKFPEEYSGTDVTVTTPSTGEQTTHKVTKDGYVTVEDAAAADRLVAAFDGATRVNAEPDPSAPAVAQPVTPPIPADS